MTKSYIPSAVEVAMGMFLFWFSNPSDVVVEPMTWTLPDRGLGWTLPARSATWTLPERGE